MIKSFAHNGLEDFFYDGTTKGIQHKHASKLRTMLDHLDAADIVQDMDLPGYGLHQLKGNLKNLWSIRVSGNWRLTFRFEGGDAYIVNYQDYH